LKDVAQQPAEQLLVPEGDGNAAADAVMEDDETNKGTAATAATPHESCLAAYRFHVKKLWCDRFGSWREQVRYWWLLARHALCNKEPWNALDPLQRCKACFETAHPDAAAAAAAAVVYLPSCQMNNCITMLGVERCLLRPQQDVRDLMLDHMALSLELEMSAARELCEVILYTHTHSLSLTHTHMKFTGEILLTGDMLHVLSADILHILLHPVHITSMM
jgi:hypothetical protein